MTTVSAAIAVQDEFLRTHHPVLWMALKHHKTHRDERIDFTDWKYLAEIYSEEAQYLVIKKSTQCGISEYLQARTFASALSGRSLFYVLPTFVLAGRYVRNRVDRVIENTKFYRRAIESARENNRRFSESAFLKHIGGGSIAFVGSNTTSVFTEYPADELVIDELDECDQDNILMGVERLSASKTPRQVKVGNPTIGGYGIDAEYRETDQRSWFIQCDHCGERFSPDFFTHVVEQVGEQEYEVLDPEWEPHGLLDARLMCKACGRPVDRFSPGEWVPAWQDRIRHGYHVSKLFSTHMTINEMIVDRFTPGLHNPSLMQRFYNADLGLAYEAEGSKITEEMLESAARDFELGTSTRASVMGVDVGNLLHIVVFEIGPDREMMLRHAEIARDFEDIVRVWQRHRCVAGCIDARPERRLSLRACHSLKGMFMAFQQNNTKSEAVDRKRRQVTVDRTAQLDTVLEKLSTGMMLLPQGARNIPDFYPQLTAATRVLDKDRQVYRWTEGSAADHYHHAVAFATTALKLLVSVGGL